MAKRKENSESPLVTTRAFELPILNIDPEEGWVILRQCWHEATCFANWCVQQLLRNDRVRLPHHTRWADLSKMPEIDLYALAFGREKNQCGKNKPLMPPSYPSIDFWQRAHSPSAATVVIKKVTDKYTQERFAVLWLRNRQVSTYKTAPWATHNRQVKECWLDMDRRPFVRLALPGGEVTLRLRGGPEFGRQMAMFVKLVQGKYPVKNFTLIEGDRNRKPMLKMVVDFPIVGPKGNRTLVLATDPNAFWVALLDGHPAWIINADHVRRKVAEHERHLRQLQRMSEDAKAERRSGTNRADDQARRLEVLCRNNRNRLDSLTHELTAHVVKFCVRQGVGTVYYLDRNKGYTPRFPWHELHTKLAYKLQRPCFDTLASDQRHTEEREYPSITLIAESEKSDDTPKVSLSPEDEELFVSPPPVDSKEYHQWLNRRMAALQTASSTTAALQNVIKARKRRGSHSSVTSLSEKC